MSARDSNHLADAPAVEPQDQLCQLARDLAYERKWSADILHSVPAVIFEYWPTGTANRNFVSGYVQTMFGYTPQEWLSTPDFWLQRVHPDDRDFIFDDVASVFSGQQSGAIRQARWITRENRVIWIETRFLSITSPIDGAIGLRGFRLDITRQKEAELQLQEAHRELVERSRLAGMAEVATSVLHNVGNVLNSVNICATLAADHAQNSSVPHLGRVAALLEQNSGKIADYLASDPVGRKLPPFLGQLAAQLVHEQSAILTELEQLRKNVEHIKDIVSVQQNYASTAGVSQLVQLVELVEDSLRMNAGSFSRHDIQLIREFDSNPSIQVDKHVVMQILVNLLRNAQHACDESGCKDKSITVRIASDDRLARISVIDNGVGISSENLTRIFNHGFTTRKNGHGFGLHSGILAAKEIGGALLVHSDGPGLGATFTLELPLENP